jgi:hypothetical protein
VTTVKLILRVIWLPVALALSLSVAVFVIVTLGQERLVRWLHTANGGALTSDVDVFKLFDMISWGLERLFTINAAGLFVPLLLVVVIGEVIRIRSVLYYIAGFGFALASMPFLVRFGQALAWPPAEVWQVSATAGFAAGALYWAIAGRSA